MLVVSELDDSKGQRYEKMWKGMWAPRGEIPYRCAWNRTTAFVWHLVCLTYLYRMENGTWGHKSRNPHHFKRMLFSKWGPTKLLNVVIRNTITVSLKGPRIDFFIAMLKISWNLRKQAHSLRILLIWQFLAANGVN